MFLVYEGCPENFQPGMPLFFILHGWQLSGRPLCPHTSPGLSSAMEIKSQVFTVVTEPKTQVGGAPLWRQ